MSVTLKVGDRVRVTQQNRVAGYQTGDKGEVLWASASSRMKGERYYTVAMDKDSPDHTGIVFTESELEPDV
jgi:hypothetical protein